MSEANTLFVIDRELDSLLDQIEEEAEENGTASPELLFFFESSGCLSATILLSYRPLSVQSPLYTTLVTPLSQCSSLLG